VWDAEEVEGRLRREGEKEKEKAQGRRKEKVDDLG
jgi:hypothetical protein